MGSPTIILMLLSLVGGAAAGLLAGVPEGKRIIQSQAIQRGFATWEIVNPETGETEFKWKEAP